MRVLLTAYVRFPNALAWHTLELAKALTADGHEVYLFCQRGSPLASWTLNEPFQVNREFNLNRAAPCQIFGGLAALRSAIRRFRPDILNPHCPPGHSFLALAGFLERSSAPLIRTVADPRPPKNNVVNRYLHERLTDGMIFTSESSVRRYRNVFTLKNDVCAVILPGFRSDDFTQGVQSMGIRERYALADDVLLIGMAARMSPEKGQEVFLQALTLLKPEERRRIFCVMAGEDSRERGRADLSALAEKYGVSSSIALLEKMEDVRPILKDLDLGLITSTRSEAISRAALEYMSFGLPVIASDVNILPETVMDGVTGWIFKNQNSEDLAACLRAALNSPDERKKRGAAGKHRVCDDLSNKSFLERTIAHYRKILANRISS